MTKRKSIANGNPGAWITDIDDYQIIADSNTEIKIKSITVYSSHYIMAIEVTYIEADLKETTVVHAANDRYKHDKHGIEKCTLNLANDEFIDFISYTYSSQKRYIRSIQIGTTGGHLMIMEGEIELNNLHTESLQNSTFSSLVHNISQDKDQIRRSAGQKPEDFKHDFTPSEVDLLK